MRVSLRICSWIVPLALLSLAAPGLAAPVMVERNLFAQDRKPPADTVVPTPQAHGPGVSASAIQLDAVILYGDTKKALIRFKNKPAAAGPVKGKFESPYTTVREGEQIGDYQVVKIEPKSIVIEKDGQSQVISIFAEGKVLPPMPTQPAGMVGQMPQPHNVPPPAPGQMIPPPPGTAIGHGQAPVPGQLPGAAIGNEDESGSDEEGTDDGATEDDGSIEDTVPPASGS